MNQAKTPHRVPAARITAAAVAVGGLAASLLAVGPAGATTKHSSKGVTVSAVKYAKLGTVLQSGKTLYELTTPSKTACTASCLAIWPELVLPKGVTKATAGSGVTASKLGTITRANGVKQVTYNGKPLYFFVEDTAAGTANGVLTDTWGKWSDVVTAKATSSSSSGSGTPTTSGGGTGTTTAGSGDSSF